MKIFHCGSRRGSTIVESAFVLSALLLLIIGTLDISRLVFMHQTLTERARNASRYGVARPYDSTKIQNMILYNNATPANGAQPIFGLSTSNVAVSKLTGATGTPDRLMIRITGWTYRVLLPYVAGNIVAPDIVTSLTMETP
jgi:Flp pilus assembly protein TadG